MSLARIAFALALSIPVFVVAPSIHAQDAAFSASAWSVAFPAPVAEPLSPPIDDERDPLERIRVGLTYGRAAMNVQSWETIHEQRSATWEETTGGAEGLHATVEVPLVPAFAVGGRLGYRRWSLAGERSIGLDTHTTVDASALIVARLPWFWGVSLAYGGVRLLGVAGLSVDALGWADSRTTTSLSPRPGWHAGVGMGVEGLIANRVAVTGDLLVTHRETRVRFDIPGGAAGSLWHDALEVSFSFGVSVLL